MNCANRACQVDILDNAGYAIARVPGKDVDDFALGLMAREIVPVVVMSGGTRQMSDVVESEREYYERFCSWECAKTFDGLPLAVIFVPLYSKLNFV